MRVLPPDSSRSGVLEPPPPIPKHEAPPPPPTLRELGEKLKAIVVGYSRIPKAEQTAAVTLGLALDYVCTARLALETANIGPHRYGADNQLMNDFCFAVQAVAGGEKHRYFHEDFSPTGSEADRRATVEAYAAAILEWAVERRVAKQTEASEAIAQTLSVAGYYHKRNGKFRTYSPGAVIKWRDACQRGTHAAHERYLGFLRNRRNLGRTLVTELERLSDVVDSCNSGHTILP